MHAFYFVIHMVMYMPGAQGMAGMDDNWSRVNSLIIQHPLLPPPRDAHGSKSTRGLHSGAHSFLE